MLLTVLGVKGSPATALRLARVTGIGRATGNGIETVVVTDMESASVTRSATENARKRKIGNVATGIENETGTEIGTETATVVMTRIVIASRAKTEIDQVKSWRLQPLLPSQSPEAFLLDLTPLDTVPFLRLATMLLARDDVS